MNQRKISLNNQTRDIKKRNNRRSKRAAFPVRYRLLAVACCLFLIVGFFFAARQHFASMDFSIKNSRLRKMSEELESDKRRLLLAKEIALSPSEIKKAAQKIGFKMISPSNIQTIRPASANAEKPRTEKSEAASPKQSFPKAQEPTTGEKPLVKNVTDVKMPGIKAVPEKSEAAR